MVTSLRQLQGQRDQSNCAAPPHQRPALPRSTGTSRIDALAAPTRAEQVRVIATNLKIRVGVFRLKHLAWETPAARRARNCAR
jgi:hypothetical protein